MSPPAWVLAGACFKVKVLDLFRYFLEKSSMSFLKWFESLLQSAAGFVWNWPVVILCLGGGLFFTFRFGLIQLRGFRHAWKVLAGRFDRPGEPGSISHYQALSAAISATVGLGNIAGVAIAIKMGGPGSVFWMWMIGLV
ncbi:MAG: sodium:alanine symporter family protein, partial [Deltaproteobacteria bacterium]|nr:sodium:alanine symporter family protein [Deltaproteobacteria bacterium]